MYHIQAYIITTIVLRCVANDDLQTIYVLESILTDVTHFLHKLTIIDIRNELLSIPGGL